MDRGSFVEKGMHSLVHHGFQMLTPLRNLFIYFFQKVERWIHIYGLPFHLWNRDNFEVIGKYLCELVGVDTCTLDFSKLDGARISGQK